MPGALDSGRSRVGDTNLTGGTATAPWREPQQDAIQVRRSVHQEREQRMGDFSATMGSKAKPLAQNQARTGSVVNLRTKSNFKRRRLRK